MQKLFGLFPPTAWNSDCTVITEDLNKANAFNHFLVAFLLKRHSKFTKISQTDLCKKPLINVTFTHSDVLEQLLNLKPDKSPGPDLIHPRVLKECAHVLARLLFILYRKSIDDGNIPFDWKTGHVMHTCIHLFIKRVLKLMIVTIDQLVSPQ